jgi:LacI family transcriptional regulator
VIATDEAPLAAPSPTTAATLYDVAREAGVSTATVSRVVHGHDRVRASTRQRVLDVIEALGYVPDGAAQSLSRKRKQVVGLVSIESRGPESEIEQNSLLFVEEVLRGVESSLGEIGWSLLISFLHASDFAYQRLQSMSGKVDGLLIAEGIVSSQQLSRLAARLPIVLVAGSPEEPNVDVVDADNRSGTKALVRHLVEVHDRTRLYYVAGPHDAPDAQARRAAFNEVLTDHRGVSACGFFEGRFAGFSGKLAAQEVLAMPRRDLPDAIICANDQMAIGAMRELQANGVRVPADIAVVGFDDIYPGALVAPALTTVRQPMRMLGERACSRLLKRIADPALPHQVELLPTRLVVRESCGCPGIGDGTLQLIEGSRLAGTTTQTPEVPVPRAEPDRELAPHGRGAHASTAEVAGLSAHASGAGLAGRAASPQPGEPQDPQPQAAALEAGS